MKTLTMGFGHTSTVVDTRGNWGQMGKRCQDAIKFTITAHIFHSQHPLRLLKNMWKSTQKEGIARVNLDELDLQSVVLYHVYDTPGILINLPMNAPPWVVSTCLKDCELVMRVTHAFYYIPCEEMEI